MADRNTPRHGAVSDPQSRQFKTPGDEDTDSLETGKFFPKTERGVADSDVPDEESSNVPPSDARIS
ncbi:hypothetical protein ACIOUE_26280 [Streptomyces xanthochromogenes]|uniref:hypothetical protein n=1 Tax=Streptomyces xanthochromogenes TaxID=67384 RepID=UPI00379A0F41